MVDQTGAPSGKGPVGNRYASSVIATPKIVLLKSSRRRISKRSPEFAILFLSVRCEPVDCRKRDLCHVVEHWSLNCNPHTRLAAPREHESAGGTFTSRLPGRARSLYAGILDFDLLRDLKGVVDLDTKIPHRAFNFLVPKKQLRRPEVSRATVYESHLCAPHRM